MRGYTHTHYTHTCTHECTQREIIHILKERERFPSSFSLYARE